MFITYEEYTLCMTKSRNQSHIKTAKTTFRILEEINDRSEATLTELTESFDLSESSLHNYLSTLEHEEYLVKDGDSYRIGLRFLDFAEQARRREQLYEIAKEEVTDLAEETGETANLLVEEHGKGVYLHHARGEQAVQMDSYIGQRVYLHTTALGKALLAHLLERRVDEIIDRHGLPALTENTVTDREALEEKLEQIREDGVAYDDEERVKGLRCVAVPIVSRDEIVEGAISVSGPTNRLQGERYRTELPEQLKDVANLIELDITYS